MKNFRIVCCLPALALCGALPIPAATATETSVKPLYPPAPPYVFWIVFALTTLLLAAGLILIFAALRGSQWSISGALLEPDDGTGKPSSSRAIALVGLIPLMATIVGIGYATIWRLLMTQDAPSLGSLAGFLGAGASLFTPYIANQIGNALSGPTVNTPSGFLNPSGGPIPPPKS